MNVDFDVGGNLTRPRPSVYELLTTKNRVAYDLAEDSCSIHKPSGKTIPLRIANTLFYLDMWVKVPRALSKHPFVRQVE